MRCFAAIPVCSVLLLAGQLAWAASPTGAPVGDGLKLGTDQEAWPLWQARLSHTTSMLPLWSQPSGSGAGSLMLAGDRYFGWGRLGDSGGLRATGALLLGAGALNGQGGSANDFFWRASHAGEEELATAVPYLGLGYSAWWARTGLGVSADLGLAAQRPSQGVRFGGVFSGSDSLDGTLRAMQIAPMFQVNLSYAF